MWSKVDEVRKSTLSPRVEAVGKVLALLMGAALVFDVAFATCLSLFQDSPSISRGCIGTNNKACVTCLEAIVPDETIDQLKAGLAEAEQNLWLNLNSPTNEFNASWSKVLSFCQKLRLVMQAKSSSAGLELREAYVQDSAFLEIYGPHLLATLKEHRKRKGLY